MDGQGSTKDRSVRREARVPSVEMREPMIREGTRKGWVAGALCLAALGVTGCGGGGGSGGGGNGSDLSDPVITLAGTSGKYSQTPQEANASNGQLKPPSMPTGTSGANQFIRLEVPFDVKRR